MEKETVILTCSSLERYVKRAQEKMHTNYPIIVIDRIYHVEPATMKTVMTSSTTTSICARGDSTGMTWRKIHIPTAIPTGICL